MREQALQFPQPFRSGALLINLLLLTSAIAAGTCLMRKVRNSYRGSTIRLTRSLYRLFRAI
ncbi:hypothetical protein BDW75DRAFT_198920 [Aspergillus navahoensis]